MPLAARAARRRGARRLERPAAARRTARGRRTARRACPRGFHVVCIGRARARTRARPAPPRSAPVSLGFVAPRPRLRARTAGASRRNAGGSSMTIRVPIALPILVAALAAFARADEPAFEPLGVNAKGTLVFKRPKDGARVLWIPPGAFKMNQYH